MSQEQSNPVFDSLIEQLSIIRNEISLNASLYTLDELNMLSVQSKYIDAAIQMNIKHGNYVIDTYIPVV